MRSVAAEENKRVRAKLLPEHDPRPISLSTALTVGDFSAKTTCCRAVAARSSNWLQPCRSLARQLPHTSSSTIYIGYQPMIQTKKQNPTPSISVFVSCCFGGSQRDQDERRPQSLKWSWSLGTKRILYVWIKKIYPTQDLELLALVPTINVFAANWRSRSSVREAGLTLAIKGPTTSVD